MDSDDVEMIADEIRSLKSTTNERLETLADRLDDIIEVLGRLVVLFEGRA